ncbi:DUF2934 domain-containing protein [Bradyrhizobium sp. 44]|uniref:DUF2934 domain-containing protein n=1 Tax=unclassified Bradyrhizobium TaxID=2631580 RepID=UPI001FFAE452|nr:MULTISPECIES: DUF2934 domain-containing protein [unclassified Bradyrhizobium]MCK1286590.1 DUF2934 domain-containing protein [Bradyrhizobium sp. 44]MCK1401285.1 DUF2934 domain-containing protein [Bradyrhizobium sp. 39]MCK1752908.1 DUF2934 domain-containing protein [Bradyrhizobium sp. 135]UPJ37100.1 DUF2934 domain-containing protein [Bradyrhizobium sp. 4]UPJ43986.1 DUF2934 domain-containing protein [Bradyrhizobium sp. 40]
MDERKKLEHQIALATRTAAYTSDENTARRLRQFADQLGRKLSPSSSRRAQITARAYQLWERAGRPSGRDLDFWTQAEREFSPGDTAGQD